MQFKYSLLASVFPFGQGRYAFIGTMSCMLKVEGTNTLCLFRFFIIFSYSYFLMIFRVEQLNYLRLIQEVEIWYLSSKTT